MTQQEVNLLFNITILIHENEILKKKDREELQTWVAQQLADNEIYTVKSGMSWGVLVDKEFYFNNKDE